MQRNTVILTCLIVIKILYSIVVEVTAYTFLRYKSNCFGTNANFPLSLRNASTHNRKYLTSTLYVFTCYLFPVLNKVVWYACKILLFSIQVSMSNWWGYEEKGRKVIIVQIFQWWLLLLIPKAVVFNVNDISSAFGLLKSIIGRNLVIKVFRSVPKRFCHFSNKCIWP